MNGTQRLSQKDKCYKNGDGGILEKAESVSQGVLESIHAVAGTTNCKRVQIFQLEKWAKEKHFWLDIDKIGSFEDRGSENEVYLSFNENSVLKLNDFRYSDDNLMPFFERIHAQNMYFPDCSYSLIGFSKNKEGKTCAVIKQPYIISNREATEKEIREELIRLGFMPQMGDEYFSNGIHDIFDASPNNVLVGLDGNLYFIDTIIYKSSSRNVNTYKSLSPKFSVKKHY